MVKWKLKSYLDAHGLTPYELVQRSALAPNTVYGMARGESRSVRLDTLATVVKTLRQVTGEPVSLADLLEIADDPEPNADENVGDEGLDREHHLWEGAVLESEGSPVLEPYDWGDVDPTSLGEPLEYVEGRGWVDEESNRG